MWNTVALLFSMIFQRSQCILPAAFILTDTRSKDRQQAGAIMSAACGHQPSLPDWYTFSIGIYKIPCEGRTILEGVAFCMVLVLSVAMSLTCGEWTRKEGQFYDISPSSLLR